MRHGLLVAGAMAVAGSIAIQAQATHVVKRAAGDGEAGEATFQRRCVMCHSLSSDVKIVGPSLYSEMRGPHAQTAA